MHEDFFFQLIRNSLKMSNFVKNEIYSNDKDLVYMFMYTYLTSIWPCFYILVYIYYQVQTSTRPELREEQFYL